MRTSLAQRAAGFGLGAWQVDGNDALAVYAVTQEAAEWVRSGNGPALIEAETYRMAGHSSSDDPKRYRSPAELAHWEDRDPLLRLETLLKTGDTPQSYFDQLADEAVNFAAAARQACKRLADPDLAGLFDRVYAEPHPVTTRERESFLAARAELEMGN
jgi:2-oxoisovalerate dehydrogenase E1 component alpha subunit